MNSCSLTAASPSSRYSLYRSWSRNGRMGEDRKYDGLVMQLISVLERLRPGRGATECELDSQLFILWDFVVSGVRNQCSNNGI